MIFAVLKKPEWAKRPCIKRQTRKVRIFFCLFYLYFGKEEASCILWILFSKASSLANQHRLHIYIYIYIYVILIGHFGKYHNTLCLSPHILHKLCFQFLLGLTNGPKRIHKQCLCKIWGDNEEYYVFFRNGLLL